MSKPQIVLVLNLVLSCKESSLSRTNSAGGWGEEVNYNNILTNSPISARSSAFNPQLTNKRDCVVRHHTPNLEDRGFETCWILKLDLTMALNCGLSEEGIIQYK
jgi:hypothetical protein